MQLGLFLVSTASTELGTWGQSVFNDLDSNKNMHNRIVMNQL